MSVGIERLHVYLPPWRFPLDREERGDESPGGGDRAMAVAPPWDDAVTMGATAARRLLERAGVAAGEIGLLVVGTTRRSAVGGPVAPLIHDLLGIHATCRSFDLYHGSYGGGAAVLVAADWIRAARGRARRALVVTTDVPALRLPACAAHGLGAAAVALLVGSEPRVLLLGEETGMWTRARREPDAAETALEEAWLDGLGGAFLAFRPLEYPEPVGEEVVTDRLARLLLQPPRPELAARGHRRLLELDWQANARRWAREQPRLAEACAAAFAEQVEPTLAILRQAGHVGAAALWLELAALLEAEGRRLGGRRLGLHAWGRGDAAEFFTGLVPATVGQVAEAGLAAALAQRRPIDEASYARAVQHHEQGMMPEPPLAGDFVLGPCGRYERIA